MAASVELKNTETPEKTPEVVDRSTEENDGVSQDTKNTDRSRRPRRRTTGYRKIPRSPPDDKKNKASRLVKGGRTRTTSVSSVASGRSQRRGGKPGRRRTASEGSAISEAGEATPLRKLRDTIMEKYQKKGLNLLNSYMKNRMELAKFDNTTSFLERCDALQLVPSKYRLSNNLIKNTRHVIRTLDRFSFIIMFADLKHNRKRRFQVSKLLAEKEAKMREMFGEELVSEILEVAVEAFEKRFNRIRDQQAKIYESLLKEYGITDKEKAEAEQRMKLREEEERARKEMRGQEKQREAVKGDDDVKDEDETAATREEDGEPAAATANSKSESSADSKSEDLGGKSSKASSETVAAAAAGQGDANTEGTDTTASTTTTTTTTQPKSSATAAPNSETPDDKKDKKEKDASEE